MKQMAGLEPPFPGHMVVLHQRAAPFSIGWHPPRRKDSGTGRWGGDPEGLPHPQAVPPCFRFHYLAARETCPHS